MPRLAGGERWGPAASWWGPGLDREPLELDVVANSLDREELLVGEAKWQDQADWPREAAALRRKAERLRLASGRKVRLAVSSKREPRSLPAGVACYTPRDVLRVLR